MNPQQVRELQLLRPRLRDDLQIHFREGPDEGGCILEDPLASKFHRLGKAETILLQRMDGSTTFAECYSRACRISKADSLTSEQALQLLGWLVRQQLVLVGSVTPETAATLQRSLSARQRFLSRINLISFRIPLGSPDRFLEPLRPMSKWVSGTTSLLIWAGIVLYSLSQVWNHWDKVLEASQGILAPNNWLWLALAWIILKVIHELAHGLVCMAHGGRIREVGILLILLMPLVYVDARDSTVFPSRWSRIHVAAAGMMAELLIASLATLAWIQLEPGPFQAFLLNVMVMGSIVTLLFNANPLMRFDGYYLLCDLLGTPNLSTRSKAWLRYGFLHRTLGIPEIAEPPRDSHSPWLYVTYGVAALLWWMLIILTLFTAAFLILDEGGWIVVALSLTALLGQKVMAARQSVEDGFLDRIRWRTTLPRLIGLVALLLTVLFVPLNQTQILPGVVRQTQNPTPRPEGDGLIREVHVHKGQTVAPGDTLVELENPDMDTRIAMLDLREKMQRIRLNQAVQSADATRIQLEREQWNALRNQLEEIRKTRESLTLRSPIKGTVVGRNLEAREGNWIPSGTELLQIINPDQLEILIAIPQSRADFFSRQIGSPVEIMLESDAQTLSGIFTSVDGRATRTPDLAELTVTSGGPIPLRSTSKEPEWLQPVFIGRLQIDLSQTERPLYQGERARVRFQSTQKSSLWDRANRLRLEFVEFLLRRADNLTAM